MTQARLVIRDAHHAIAKEIQDRTHLTNLSEVVGVLLTRYGKHLVETWQLQPQWVAEPAPVLPAAEPVGIATFTPSSPPIDPGDDLPPLEF